VTHTRSYCLSDLGFHFKIQQYLQKAIQLSSGLILVTGPTGSGKTTTLYALLHQMVENKKGNIVTLEDPVERVIPQVRQTPINTKAGLDFYEGLKALLRQDPDVLMVGEIRDKKTAEVALDAAYTGHLVLSSLHTDTVKNSMLRLLHFGLDPFLMGYCLKVVLTQKLLPFHAVKDRVPIKNIYLEKQTTQLENSNQKKDTDFSLTRKPISELFYNENCGSLSSTDSVDKFLNQNIHIYPDQ
jgi:type II secretory ATPase GspE/PulE/Tfp pilus assembly ATPase PilB-like protein